MKDPLGPLSGVGIIEVRRIRPGLTPPCIQMQVVPQAQSFPRVPLVTKCIDTRPLSIWRSLSNLQCYHELKILWVLGILP
jgi:hypothetical protein